MKQVLANAYDYPQYWELAFQGETGQEADFIEAVARKYCDFPVRRLFEPGCGGGRLVIEMAQRGYQVTALDLSAASVSFAQRQLKHRRLKAKVLVGDMTNYVTKTPVDVAYNLMNTFRHLLSEKAARSHLQSMAESIRPGGLFVLGLHLLPPDADLEDSERWTEIRGNTRVTTSLRVLDASRRKRVETIRFSLRIRDGDQDLRLRSDYQLRIYTAAQLRSLIRSVPEFEICEVFDFCYEIDHPLKLNDDLGDTVVVMRRISEG